MENTGDNFPQSDLEQALYSSVKDLGVSWLFGISAEEIDESMRGSGFDNAAIERRIISITQLLFSAGLKYILDNCEDDAEVKNIASYLANSLFGDSYQTEKGVFIKKPLVPIIFSRGAQGTASACAVNCNLPVAVHDGGIVNVTEPFSGQVITIDEKKFTRNTVTFVHEERENEDFPKEKMIVEYLYIPDTFIDKVGENPYEALADIVEAGSIMRDRIVGVYDVRESEFRASIYRAEFLAGFLEEDGYDSLSEHSRMTLDWYTDILSRPELARTIFYSRDVRLSGLTFQGAKDYEGSPRITLN